MLKRLHRSQLTDSSSSDRKTDSNLSSTDTATLSSVAGLCPSLLADISDITSFLSNPRPYLRLGARLPRGVLLHGPPGTGKTLIARALAGEVRKSRNCAFVTCTASDFVELLVGRGAARVRELFAGAKEEALRRRASCGDGDGTWWSRTRAAMTWGGSRGVSQPDNPAVAIVFIDEIDAVAKSRCEHGFGNDEREQTLNQLLAEMDGFASPSDQSNDVVLVVLAATNRPGLLDPALLRPGRFDRVLEVGVPVDAKGRYEILCLHGGQVPLLREGGDVWKSISADRFTGGFSGADLASVVNEAAILAVRREALGVELSDAEKAVKKVKHKRILTIPASNLTIG
mmetsp:Transcript_25275/g.58385  ORF Transcript_25275/g.58385 Transcript_25275/m.58385 type:complete len:342 (-) Transcript_25275:10-1035(-)